MAQLLSLEMGAPIDAARNAQVPAGDYHMADLLRAYQNDFTHQTILPQHSYNTDTTEEEEDDEYEDGFAKAATTLLYQPIGVVGCITPWNWPMNQVVLKVIASLLVGCTCILKPSELAPLSSLYFATLIDQANFPPGVFQLLNGNGTVGAMLSKHEDIDMISFTGSTKAGVQVVQDAAPTFKKVVTELGGKGAAVIFDDVDVDWFPDRIEGLVQSVFFNSGQTCTVPSRILVHSKWYAQAIHFTKLVAQRTTVDVAYKKKEKDDGSPVIGPVVSQRQYDRIQRYIQSGIDQGARLLVGGLGKPPHLSSSSGYFVRPTVFTDCTTNMTIMQEEIFGPVLCLVPFTTEEEAIAIVNDTPYGLTNYVYSQNRRRRQRMARAVRSGMVEMNDVGGDDGAPFGGIKASGNGKEGGIYGLREFCYLKAITGWNEMEGDQDDNDDDDEEDWEDVMEWYHDEDDEQDPQADDDDNNYEEEEEHVYDSEEL